MKQQKQDRRSQRTRLMIITALGELLRERRYEAVTVQDILDRANIGRSTFYTHYFDKEDVMASLTEYMMNTLQQHLSQKEREQEILPSLEMFRHVQENYQVMAGLMRGYGTETFWKIGQAIFRDRIEQALTAHLSENYSPSIPLPMVSQYLTGAFMHLLKWWVEAEMPYTPEQIDSIFRQLAMPGVWAIMEKATE
ncbi:MAG TPA: TetR/AcrR family transcriptional regulator [Ktedonosporobacter sp.]|nr:TetR/AcrR family transcriptional regulator [Ktedonosporobacter sp.]